MSWQRFNRTSNVFEVSDNNGASWQTLVIAAAGVNVPVVTLPPNIAYTNVNNNFTADQSILTGTISVSRPDNAIAELDLIAGGYNYRLLNYTAKWGLYYGSGWLFNIDSVGSLWCKGHGVVEGNLTCLGTFTSAGTIGTDTNVWRNNLHTSGGYIYPGSPGTQSAWYLAGNPSYGLYTNTGLYLESNIWCSAVEARAHIRAAGWLYDLGRGVPVGYRNVGDPASYCHGQVVSVSGQMSWSYHGKTMNLIMHIVGYVPGDFPYINVSLPDGVLPMHDFNVPVVFHHEGLPWLFGWARFYAGTYYFTIYMQGAITIGPGNVDIGVNTNIPIQ